MPKYVIVGETKEEPVAASLRCVAGCVDLVLTRGGVTQIVFRLYPDGTGTRILLSPRSAEQLGLTVGLDGRIATVDR